MKHLIKIKYLIFTIGMIVNIQISAQGDALSAVITYAYNQSCDEGSIDLTVTGGVSPFTYEWTYDDGSGPTFFASTQDVSDLRGSYEYCVTVTDALCGTVSDCYDVNCCEINVSAEVTHSANQSCDGGSIDLTVSGASPFTYEWTFDEGSGPSFFASTQDILDIRGSYEYCVTVTSSQCGSTNECWDVYCCPELPIESISHYCGTSSLGQINLDLSGGYNYYVSWFDSDGNSLSGSDKGIYNLNPGTYTAYYESQNCVFTRTYEILDYNITYNTLDFDNPSCYWSNTDGNISIVVNSSGGIPYTITWYDSFNGYPSGDPIGTGEYISNLGEGEYIAVIETEHCSIMTAEYRLRCCTQYDKEGQPGPTLPFPAFTSLQVKWETSDGACDGGIVFTTNMPNYISKKITIKKMPENIIISNSNNLCAGMYCITLDNGCDVYTECITVESCASQNIVINGTVTNTCAGYKKGSISLNVTGGNVPYSYKWSDGTTSAIINDLGQGQHCVTVTDVHECKVNACFTVGLNKLDTTRLECAFFVACNNVQVHQYTINRIGTVRASDCRYIDYVCEDGYPAGEEFRGTYTDPAVNCVIYERCWSNNQIYMTHYGVPKNETLGPLWRDDCLVCHTVRYCEYPTLGYTTSDFDSDINNAYGIALDSTKQNCDGGEDVCKIAFYCGGVFWRDVCVEDCSSLETHICEVDESDLPFVGEVTENRAVEESSSSEESEQNNDAIIVNYQDDVKYFKIYPNPTRDLVNLEYLIPNDGDEFTVLLYSFTGQLINTLHYKSENENIFQFSLQDVKSGPIKVLVLQDSKIVFQSTIIKI